MSMKLAEAVKLARGLEREEVDYYRLASNKTENPSGRKVFSYLAEEEESHLNALEKHLELIDGGKSWLSDEDVFDKKSCKKISSKKPDGIIPGEVSADTSDVEALMQAINIEEKSIAFYEDAACKVNDKETLKLFHYIIQEEKDHLRELELQLAFLKSEGMWLDVDVVLS